MIDSKNISKLFENYKILSSYLNISSLSDISLQKISQRYHYHLNEGKISLKEHNLLPKLKTQDGKIFQKPYLPIAIYLDNLRSGFNVGSIIRTTEALRVGKIYFAGLTLMLTMKK